MRVQQSFYLCNSTLVIAGERPHCEFRFQVVLVIDSYIIYHLVLYYFLINIKTRVTFYSFKYKTFNWFFRRKKKHWIKSIKKNWWNAVQHVRDSWYKSLFRKQNCWETNINIYQLTRDIQLCNSYSRVEGLSLCDLYSRAFINICLASSLSVYVKLAVLFARIVKSRFGTSFPFFLTLERPLSLKWNRIKSNKCSALSVMSLWIFNGEKCDLCYRHKSMKLYSPWMCFYYSCTDRYDAPRP